MAQTTGGMSFREVKIETSPDGAVWTDRSGFANSVNYSGGDRDIGNIKTADGDTPIVTAGKRNVLEVTVKVVYTEGAADMAEVVRAAYEAATALYVRWSPKGGQTGEFVYTSGPGFVKGPAYPQGTVDNGDPVTIDFTIVVPSITKSVAA